MLCAGCDGGQHTVDQRSAAGCCAGCLPCFEDGCSRHHLPAEKCGRRCSSTDASTWQDGLVAILRNALCKDTGRKYRPLFSLLLFSLAKSLTRLEELRDERNLRPKIGSPTPLHYPLPGASLATGRRAASGRAGRLCGGPWRTLMAAYRAGRARLAHGEGLSANGEGVWARREAHGEGVSSRPALIMERNPRRI